MMNEAKQVICFTSFTYSYLNRARVLGKSIRKYHPDWHFVAVISDIVPAGFDFDISHEPFDEVILGTDLSVGRVKSWLFRHDIVELCTSVKGPALVHLLSRAQKVVYLDPDTALFGRMDDVIDILDTSEIVLTPHQLCPDTKEQAIWDNEVCSLGTGTYNLGFFAVRAGPEGLKFANWWSDRLLSYSYDQIEDGLFTDQRWCDLVPCLFKNVKVLRHPGYNVASWNLSQRFVRISTDGMIYVNDNKLVFWHFTKLGPLGDVMTYRYASSSDVFEVWRWYREQVAMATSHEIPERYWAFSHYENGKIIQKKDRVMYRNSQDLQQRFRNPFADGDDSYFNYVVNA